MKNFLDYILIPLAFVFFIIYVTLALIIDVTTKAGAILICLLVGVFAGLAIPFVKDNPSLDCLRHIYDYGGEWTHRDNYKCVNYIMNKFQL